MTPSVLIIEDSLTQAHLIGRLFERAGFRSGVATDRATALKELNRQTWALLAIDIFMAEENSLAISTPTVRRPPTRRSR